MNHTDKRLREPDPSLLAALEATNVPVTRRATDRLAAAHDASHYLLTPLAIATPSSTADVAALFAVCREQGVSLTFRSGGTSLSGQAGTSGVMADTRRHFRSIEVLDEGRRVRTGPGATVRAVNARLARYGRKLGPDPASEIACTIGGVVSNNSSGMSCGTHSNTYRTLESAVVVLPSGTIVDTGRPDADEFLRVKEPELYSGLLQLRDRVRGNSESVAAISSLYAIKNTMGYGVNSFVDHDRAVDILAHLVVGSEGTLAFVAEATFNTLAIRPHAATGLLFFPDLASATGALPALIAAGFATIELLDATSLRVAQRDPDATDELRSLTVVDHAALLVEYQEEDSDGLVQRLDGAPAVFEALALDQSTELTTDPKRRAQLWHLRKGLYTQVAGNRPSGTTALLEDIAVPVERLYSTCVQLVALFDKYAYEESVIFGHAKDGNIHFLLNERFNVPELLTRYEAFTEEMVELVLSHGGTLKAEHGTGRIMAPFVRRQYGDELYSVMEEIKRLFDPAGLLNPGVILTSSQDSHVKDLKTSLAVEEEVDRCVECGYCEPVCPSRDLTLTPRQRIVLRREMAEAEAAGDAALLRELQAEYDYDGVETCAVDGMCQTACPVLINTGDLVRRLRRENQNRASRAGWSAAAKHWDVVSRAGGAAMTVAGALPSALPKAATAAARTLLGRDVVPDYSAELPGGGTPRKTIPSAAPHAIYFSSCTNTMFGPVGESGVSESFLALCERAGVNVATPDDIPSLCCGTPWKSKGLTDGYGKMRRRVADSLLRATRGGALPVVCDASSCTEGLRVLLDAADAIGIEVVDAVEFVDSTVLPRLGGEPQKVSSVTLHPTCSSVHLELSGALSRVAEAAAERVIVPEEWGCCAFAGDRGMLHPELTASATRAEAAEAVAADTDTYASLNRTCELGMTRATGREYEHILQVLDRATRETNSDPIPEARGAGQ
ncbi:FAD-binding and (Fe-S)-binding domain-containing protein [Microbacterium mangrovi]|uniref:FAD-binding and (Fe-S)-binding domain-containing protein n=1 Tax=Microbacterium mangrovi TaxID=1348253 RepID=UPI000690E128|nr:FAD-binding and (Fe-S)-binding domain-containing protein [Microbacterium mangrovi]